MRARWMKHATLLAIASSMMVGMTAGCEDDLPKASLIAHMRVLGGRTEVVGDETRSTPRPGETARLTWSVVFPDLDANEDELSSLFAVCTMPDRFTGNPVCQELIDSAQGRRRGFGLDEPPMGCDVRPDSQQTYMGIRINCVSGTPRLDVRIPESLRTDRLVQGIVCRNGTPAFDLESPVGARCYAKPGFDEDDVESVALYGTIPVVEDADDENLNPDLSRLQLTMRATRSANERAWNPTPEEFLPELIEDCSTVASDIVLPSNGYPEVIELSYPPQPGSEDDEDLVFSTFATLGELSRRFTVIEAETGRDPDQPDLTWELSEAERDELLGTPTLVRFYFTVLDGRGGFDVTTRELCVNRL